ncbi:MAG: hypothetical protein ABI628_03230 [Chloroflexota bacterium]
MWQLYYVRAQELALERILEAERERSARQAHRTAAGASRIDRLRRGGALAAAGLARRLDECVAREALAIPRHG